MNDQPTICVAVQPSNPGQFFACCGLLELTNRLWPDAEGWFKPDEGMFCIALDAPQASPAAFLNTLKACDVRSLMTPQQRERFEFFQGMKSRKLSPSLKHEKSELEQLQRASPVVLGQPFDLTIDWFLDQQTGGSRFKTWAGRKSALEIARDMKTPLSQGHYDDVDPQQWLSHPSGNDVTFNFDSDSSVQASGLDIGFVLDPLGMKSASRPLLEFLAFVGLQRFRPLANPRANAHTYALWEFPLSPMVAAAMASGVLGVPGLRRYTFPLLYRTKYLKSFLPANPNGESR